MEILGMFGIDPILLSAQIVNFLIVFYILKRFALKPILAMLKNREKTIREGLEQAQEAQKLLVETAEKEKTVLRKAQLEAKAMLDEAKKHRDDLLAETEKKTKDQADKILQEAREQITFETKEAEKRLVGHISALAVDIIKRSSSELFSQKDQAVVIENAVKNLKKKAN
ncbi:MAG: F0F1 ATP synthase subunit B [Patescibacteria group bacterium]